MTEEANRITFAEAAVGDHARAGAALVLVAAASLRIAASDEQHRQTAAPAELWPPGFTWSLLDPLRDLARGRDLIAQEISTVARRQRAETKSATSRVELALAELQDALAQAKGGGTDVWKRIRALAGAVRSQIEAEFAIDLSTLGPRR